MVFEIIPNVGVADTRACLLEIDDRVLTLWHDLRSGASKSNFADPLMIPMPTQIHSAANFRASSSTVNRNGVKCGANSFETGLNRKLRARQLPGSEPNRAHQKSVQYMYIGRASYAYGLLLVA